MSLARKIVALRKERNLTQKELARIVGVHFSHMSRYERGISLPSVEVVKKIAQMFGVSTDYLLLDDSETMIQAQLADQELLRQFQQISVMSEREKSAVKTLLEGLIVKHQIETMLGVKSSPSQSDGVVPERLESPLAPLERGSGDLYQGLHKAVDGKKVIPAK
jgi:transcriptional regulator with XRE-family HTH domain